MMIFIIILVVLVILGVGVYFVFRKKPVPAEIPTTQCANKAPDAASNVSTWVLDSDSGACVANVCMNGYGDKDNKPVSGQCRTYSHIRSYKKIGQGTCADGSSGITPIIPPLYPMPLNYVDCQTACDNQTGCLAYSWGDSSGPCSLYASAPNSVVKSDSDCFALIPPS